MRIPLQMNINRATITTVNEKIMSALCHRGCRRSKIAGSMSTMPVKASVAKKPSSQRRRPSGVPNV